MRKLLFSQGYHLDQHFTFYSYLCRKKKCSRNRHAAPGQAFFWMAKEFKTFCKLWRNDRFETLLWRNWLCVIKTVTGLLTRMDHGDNEQPPIFLYRDDHQSLIVLTTISIDVHIERLSSNNVTEQGFPFILLQPKNYWRHWRIPI